VAEDLSTKPTVAPRSDTVPDDLVLIDRIEGEGDEATTEDTVTVQYVGVTYGTAQEFDSSWDRGEPATFPLDRVIAGFRDGIAGMRVGGRREIVVPSEMGYGAAGAPPAIRPHEDLVFVVDLLAVNEAQNKLR
jgi:peptidylprolyl isomerase